MKFPGSVTVNTCEQFLSRLDANLSESLVFPVKTMSPTFSGTASAIQAINTWARKSQKKELLLTSSSKYDVSDWFNEIPHKFVAAMYSTKISVLGEEENDLRPKLYDSAKNLIEAQGKSLYGQMRGGLCWFAFVDHSSKAFDPNFYRLYADGSAEPKQLDQFKAVIAQMVEKSMSVVGGAKPLSGSALNSLGRVFYELFLNTHEHGTRDQLRSKRLRSSVRVLYTRASNLGSEGGEKIIENQTVLNNYLKSLKEAGSSQKRLFVEIGIIDSGLGYCGRWLADQEINQNSENLSIEEEYKFFKQCFQFRRTSTSIDSKGVGLPVVMNRLTELKALIKIRSGRLSLYRNFVSFPFNNVSDECNFFDWLSGESAEEKITSMAESAGVSITLLIPLEVKE